MPDKSIRMVMNISDLDPDVIVVFVIMVVVAIIFAKG